MVRAGIVAHGVMFGVLLLFLGLIHVAPLGATPRTSTTAVANARGHVRVDARPWALVYVDNVLAGVTPLGRPLELAQGKHQIRFEHDWYQPITRAIDVTGDSDVAIDFEKSGVLKPGKAKP
jgi:hypothetical protein